MNFLPDRPQPVCEIAIKKKYPNRNPNVDSPRKADEDWRLVIFKKTLIVLFVLFIGIMMFMLFDARTSYNYRIAVNGNRYQCNIIERGNPTYLKDCWQGDDIVIYDPINLVIVE